MELIRGLHNLRARHHGCVATIGNYDGVHRGHQAILAQLQEQARAHGLPSTVMIFEPMPREFFAPEQAPPRIASLREKLEDLDATGVARVLCVRFDARFAALSPQDFITQVLVEGLGVKHLAVGDDFRFGHRRAGDFTLLQQAGRAQGFAVEHLPAFCLDGERVSSTRIRAALTAGNLAQAARLLGRPYRIDGRVAAGQKLGRQLGVPTANLPLRQRRALRYGVYAARVDIPGARPCRAVTACWRRTCWISAVTSTGAGSACTCCTSCAWRNVSRAWTACASRCSPISPRREPGCRPMREPGTVSPKP
jgi:riboflavin kinase / FMN adenylyltransferase